LSFLSQNFANFRIAIHKNNLPFRKIIQIFVIVRKTPIYPAFPKRLKIKSLLQKSECRDSYNSKLFICKGKNRAKQSLIGKTTRQTAGFR
jgi:hypothetical protein